ncbi:MAG: redoxin domain-containing protein, partial [Chloroflexi bacterium]|nr:redoxin domain-containing protein [Chloroflexota bacterium]
MDLEIGMKAPNFSLNNQKGVKKINKNYDGKKLVIYFYR